MIIALYLTLFFLVLRFTVTLFNFISNPKLTRVNRQYTDLVSVLIPTRNEEDNILILLQSILKQDYPSYEVIIYDDCSTDNTYNFCREFATKHSAFKVIKGKELPDGWTGKNYACFNLAQEAKGKYFLFLDADTCIFNNLINSTINRMQVYKLSLLSIFPDQVMKTFGEKVTVPLLNYLLLNMTPLRAIYLFKSQAFAVACGQFMLFDSVKYRQNQWHQMVKQKVVEDAEIMKAVKRKGYSGEVLLANRMITCRMYKSYPEALNGFSKNALALFNYSIPTLLIFIILLFSGPVLVLTTTYFSLIFFMAGLIALSRVMSSLESGQNALLNVVLHPIQIINLVFIALLSIHKNLTRNNTWKGRYLNE